MRYHGSVGRFTSTSGLLFGLRRISTVVAIGLALLANSSATSFASTEAAPATLDTPTSNDSITMTFTGPINVSRTTMTVYGPHGRVQVGPLKQGSSEGQLVIPLYGDLAPGLYVVHFQAFSDWGASMSGTTTVEVRDRPPMNASLGRGLADASGGI
jgi:methionine-rich copper-binding protein CopC